MFESLMYAAQRELIVSTPYYVPNESLQSALCTAARRGVTLDGDRVRLDFNYAYNPSCAYDEGWRCPLAPFENRLTAEIRAGEQVYKP